MLDLSRSFVKQLQLPPSAAMSCETFSSPVVVAASPELPTVLEKESSDVAMSDVASTITPINDSAPSIHTAVDVTVLDLSGSVVEQLQLPPSAKVADVKRILQVRQGITLFGQQLLCEDILCDEVELQSLGQTLTLTLLIAKPSDDPALQNQLHNAIRAGNVNETERFLRIPVRPDIKDTSGMTALYLAAHYGHHDIVRLLCEAGADKDQEVQGQGGCEEYGVTPLAIAAKNNRVDALRVLLELGADADKCQGRHSRMALVKSAALLKQTEVVELLGIKCLVSL
jgi:hypothetical protein